MTQKLAWITGGSTGIGAATAQRLAKEGWIVAVTSSTAKKVETFCQSDPKFLKPYPGDVTKPKKMAELIEQIEKDLGPIDMAILNAGISGLDHAEEFTHQNFKKLFDVNVLGVGNCLDPLLKKFMERGYGHIAITASVAGYRGLPRSLSYSATKAALINLAESLAIELYKTNIKVQLICPGFVKTPLTDKNDFDMPMIMEVDKAAEKLVDGLKSNKFEITFPWSFALFLKLFGIFPSKLYFWLLAKVKEKRLAEKNEAQQDKKKT